MCSGEIYPYGAIHFTFGSYKNRFGGKGGSDATVLRKPREVSYDNNRRIDEGLEETRH